MKKETPYLDVDKQWIVWKCMDRTVYVCQGVWTVWLWTGLGMPVSVNRIDAWVCMLKVWAVTTHFFQLISKCSALTFMFVSSSRNQYLFPDRYLVLKRTYLEVYELLAGREPLRNIRELGIGCRTIHDATPPKIADTSRKTFLKNFPKSLIFEKVANLKF